MLLMKDNARLNDIVNNREMEKDDIHSHLNERDSLMRKKEMRLMRINQVYFPSLTLLSLSIPIRSIGNLFRRVES